MLGSWWAVILYRQSVGDGHTATLDAAVNKQSNEYYRCRAQSRDTDGSFLMAVDRTLPTNDQYRLFTWDNNLNTFSSLHDINAPLSAYPPLNVLDRDDIFMSAAFGQDTSTNTAVLTAGLFGGSQPPGYPPLVLTVNLLNGAVSSLPASTTASFFDVDNGSAVAVDSRSNVAFLPYCVVPQLLVSTNCDDSQYSEGLRFYTFNPSTRELSAGILSSPGAGPPLSVVNAALIAVDARRGELLFQDQLNQLSISEVDANYMGYVAAVDERGRFIKAIGGIHQSINGDLSLNPTTHSGYVINASDGQIVPFSY